MYSILYYILYSIQYMYSILYYILTVVHCVYVLFNPSKKKGKTQGRPFLGPATVRQAPPAQLQIYIIFYR